MALFRLPFGKDRPKRNSLHIKEDNYELIIHDTGEQNLAKTVAGAAEMVVATGTLHHLIVGAARAMNQSAFSAHLGEENHGHQRWEAIKADIKYFAEAPYPAPQGHQGEDDDDGG